MRLRRIDRYLLLLAGFFVAAILVPTDLPGEELLPGVYRTAVFKPLLAQAAAGAAADELDVVKLRSELEASQREVALLKEQLEAAHDLSEYFKKLRWRARPVARPGWVFAVDSDEFRRHFMIDCDAPRSVVRGSPVVTGKALLGLVLRGNPQYVEVQRVDDPRFRIEVEIETEEGPLPCVAQGDGAGGLELKLVRNVSSLAKDQPVFTSSYHPKIPPGLLVGWIDAVEEDEEGEGAFVTVRTAASLERLAQVEILEQR